MSSGFTLPSWLIGAPEQLLISVTVTTSSQIWGSYLSRRGHPDPEALNIIEHWGLSQLSSNTVKNYPFHLWNMYQDSCLRLLIYIANVVSSVQVRRSSVLVLVSDCKKDIEPDMIMFTRDDIDESIKCDDFPLSYQPRLTILKGFQDLMSLLSGVWLLSALHSLDGFPLRFFTKHNHPWVLWLSLSVVICEHLHISYSIFPEDQDKPEERRLWYETEDWKSGIHSYEQKPRLGREFRVEGHLIISMYSYGGQAPDAGSWAWFGAEIFQPVRSRTPHCVTDPCQTDVLSN